MKYYLLLTSVLYVHAAFTAEKADSCKSGDQNVTVTGTQWEPANVELDQDKSVCIRVTGTHNALVTSTKIESASGGCERADCGEGRTENCTNVDYTTIEGGTTTKCLKGAATDTYLRVTRDSTGQNDDAIYVSCGPHLSEGMQLTITAAATAAATTTAAANATSTSSGLSDTNIGLIAGGSVLVVGLGLFVLQRRGVQVVPTSILP